MRLTSSTSSGAFGHQQVQVLDVAAQVLLQLRKALHDEVDLIELPAQGPVEHQRARQLIGLELRGKARDLLQRLAQLPAHHPGHHQADQGREQRIAQQHAQGGVTQHLQVVAAVFPDLQLPQRQQGLAVPGRRYGQRYGRRTAIHRVAGLEELARGRGAQLHMAHQGQAGQPLHLLADHGRIDVPQRGGQRDRAVGHQGLHGAAKFLLPLAILPPGVGAAEQQHAGHGQQDDARDQQGGDRAEAGHGGAQRSRFLSSKP
jgi:hypothetical protein